VVQGGNESAAKLFGREELPGLDLRELVSREVFQEGELGQPFTHATMSLVGMHQADGSSLWYEIASTIHGDRLVMTFRDMTQSVRYDTLIAEERDRSEQLLKSILPPSLVPRVQAGESDISFSVQSASFSFIDIVEFTPWCGKTPAATVMKILNTLFNFFDEEIASRPVLMREKCIGDCYVTAGGIFAESDAPMVHAKEMVSFGLAAIQALQRLNVLFEETLRCRVGVNTGGPLVAGVLGGAKPTFEILGPAINLAQQMEHHGVPMNVHVSRSVYELIYGDAFEVREKGQTEIKGGPVVTYLVSGMRVAPMSQSSSMASRLSLQGGSVTGQNSSRTSGDPLAGGSSRFGGLSLARPEGGGG
jgi:class 3 adenylate cyclase